MKKIGILLTNLGTPKSYKLRDVYRYLKEFLLDERVIDYPWWKRQLLVRGIIIPARIFQSAAFYRDIWTPEGSPLLVHGRELEKKLQECLGKNYLVRLAMRYQDPSIEEGIEFLLDQAVERIIIFPLFPQYSSATTGSVHQKVMEVLNKKKTIPSVSFISSYADHPALIKAFSDIAKKYPLNKYDQFLFSFHGLPERQILNSHPSHCYLKKVDCCSLKKSKNLYCYRAQCFATMQGIIHYLGLPLSKCSYSFQSRLGKEPWLQPYTQDVIQELPKTGKKNVLVFCPSFVCDCLETISEIEKEYFKEFIQSGGETLQLVEGLNTHPSWIQAIANIVSEYDGSLNMPFQEAGINSFNICSTSSSSVCLKSS